MSELRSIAVFCGSSVGHDPRHRAAATELGKRLGRDGLTLVYGGGRVGLMGILADAALGAGGRVIGVIPAALEAREVAHRGLTELRVVATMHDRKALISALSDAFVALPGGFGTLDELFETVTWAQLGIHRKPIGLLNVAGYFGPLLEWVDRSVADGFARPDHRGLFLVDEDVGALLSKLAAAPPPAPAPKV